jgi:hypothetical protein
MKKLYGNDLQHVLDEVWDRYEQHDQVYNYVYHTIRNKTAYKTMLVVYKILKPTRIPIRSQMYENTKL